VGRCRSVPHHCLTIEYIKTGRLRALAVTTATRSDALPDIPTVGEFVAGYEASAWLGQLRLDIPLDVVQQAVRRRTLKESIGSWSRNICHIGFAQVRG